MLSGPSGLFAPVDIPETTIVYFVLTVCSATVFLYATCTASYGLRLCFLRFSRFSVLLPGGRVFFVLILLTATGD